MALWWCTRQRAGPLVKECRALRPRLQSTDDVWTRSDKTAVLRPRVSVLGRSAVARLELRLALFGYDGLFYTLTYSDDGLPPDFGGVRRDLRNFFGRVRRRRSGVPWDYVYAIEGLHGNGRWHIHLVLRETEFPPETVRALWPHGHVDAAPLLRQDGGFLRIAAYINKERAGGKIPLGRHPWSCSRSLNRKLPRPERWRDESGVIEIPQDAVWTGRRTDVVNEWGAYHFAEWLEPGRGYGKIFRAK